jgi:signal transduction histidine kinase
LLEQEPALIQSMVKVLLIEDDEDDMVLVSGLLREIQTVRFELAWESDYERGLARLCAESFDICVLDYRLGARNGVELVGEAGRRGCRVPIILLTSQDDLDVDLAAMNAGAADFLNKGQINAAVLERSIRYSIQQRKVQDQQIRLLTEQAARAQAEAANRAKDQFLAVLSHELRTPLTAVLMSVSALEQEPEIPPRSRELFSIIKRNVDLEARLIDDLLDITRITRGKLELRKEVVDLHEQIREAVGTCCGSEIEQKQIAVSIHTNAQRHHVFGDPARLQQVLWNLIKNAVKFTPELGRIEIRTSNRDEGSGLRVQGSANATIQGSAESKVSSLNPEPRTPNPSSIVIEVSDSGIGIESEALPKIFNAFEQADRKITREFGGLGLGLAICRALVEMHGGTIRARSAGRNQGATFSVELPLAPAASQRSGVNGQPAAPAKLPERGVCILLVEDHTDTARAMTTLLNRRGYDVRRAANMAEALKEANNRKFDVLVSDIGLPDGSGLELMRQLLEKGPVKGIALSGFGMEEDVNRSRQAGFSEHLTKPIDFKQLEAAIARVTG